MTTEKAEVCSRNNHSRVSQQDTLNKSRLNNTSENFMIGRTRNVGNRSHIFPAMPAIDAILDTTQETVT
jgi:hypothetical protein